MWVLDSGASNHMTNDRRNFTTFKEVAGHQVTTGDNGRIPVKGRGTVRLEISLDEGPVLLDLTNVLYVPDLLESLISVAVLSDRGCSINFKGNIAEVCDQHGQPVMRGRKTKGLYQVIMKSPSTENVALTATAAQL
jgi:hypothetical protein